jgi:3-hydroxybutyryl-CoA dehydrogenase
MIVTVIGAGIMGSGISQLCAVAGHETRVVDRETAALDRARIAVADSTRRLVRSGRLTEQARDEALDRMTYQDDLAAAAAGSDVLIEAVTEELHVKHEVLRTATAGADEGCLIGTNTSQLSITSIAAGVPSRADRIIVMHFFNPPAVMRLVELIRGLRSSDECVHHAQAFVVSLGLESVVCAKDTPGFLTSRISAILRLECLRMLDEGLASAADIDKAIRLAFNHPMGPLELGDFNGLDTYLHALDGLHAVHGERFRPPALLRNMVDAGFLGRKTGQGFYRYQRDGRPEPAPAESR